MKVYVVTSQYEFGSDIEVEGVFKSPVDAAKCLSQVWSERDNMEQGGRPGIIGGSYPNTHFQDVNPTNLDSLTGTDSEGHETQFRFDNGNFIYFQCEYGFNGSVEEMTVQ